MPNDTAASARRREMDKWLATLDPSLRAVFDAAYDSWETARNVMPAGQQAAVDAGEETLLQSAKAAAQAQGAGQPSAAPGATATPPAAAPAADAGHGSVQVGAEVEVATTEIKGDTKLGQIKVTISLKVAAAEKMGDGGPVGFSATGTSKDTSKGRKTGTKKNFSYKDFDKHQLFEGLEIKDIAIGGEFEISGSDLSISAAGGFTIHTKAFDAKAQVKLVLVKVKDGKDIEWPGLEFKIEPTSFPYTLGDFTTTVKVEFKASFVVDPKKIGAEIAEKALKDYAKKKLEEEAAKQGGKMLGREAAEAVLGRLGPIAAAFSVGWDIGKLLDTFTMAPEIAGDVYERILGDLNDRFQRASTLGKIGIVYWNMPKIAAAVVAAGFAGAVAGVSDLIVFKLLHLDKLGPAFTQAYELFHAMLAAIPNFGQGMADMIVGSVLSMGIKFNPTHHAITDPNLAIIAASVFKTIKPLYKKSGGLQEIIDLTLEDIDVPEKAVSGAVAMVFAKHLSAGASIDLTNEHTVLDSFLELGLQNLLGFMEANNLVSYTVKLSNELGVDAIDQGLLAELFL